MRLIARIGLTLIVGAVLVVVRRLCRGAERCRVPASELVERSEIIMFCSAWIVVFPIPELGFHLDGENEWFEHWHSPCYARECSTKSRARRG